MDILTVLTVVGSGTVFLAVIDLIRRGKLKERYSLLWLCASAVLLLFSLSRRLLEFVSHLVGIFYPPSFLFLLAFLFILVIALHFSAVISGLSDQNKRLAQELALLKGELDAKLKERAKGA
jgi:hypothetical protein